MGVVTKEIEKRSSNIRGGRVVIHRDQVIVERLNRILAARLFRHQYAVEMRLSVSQRSSGGATSRCGPTLNCEVTRLTSKKPGEAIKEKAVYSKPATSCVRLVGRCEKRIPFSAVVRYLYQPGELEGGRKRASDPI